MTALRLAAATPWGGRLTGWLLGVMITGAAFAFGLVFAGLPRIATFGMLGVLALAVSLAVPSAATTVVITILYSNAAAVAVRDTTLPQFVALAFPLLLALPLGDQLLLKRKPVLITAGLPYLFGYMLAEVLATIFARDPVDASQSLVSFLIGGFGLYFVITNVLRTYGSLRSAVWVVLIVAAGLGALTTFQAVTHTYGNQYAGFATIDLPGKDQPNEQLLASTPGIPRSSGPSLETNRYGQVMLVLLPIGVMLALGERRRRYRALAVGLTALILMGMVTSFSRGAVVGLVAVILVAVLFRYVRLKHLAAVALAFVVLLIAFPKLGDRLGELQGLAAIDSSTGTSQTAGDTGSLRGRATAAVAAFLVWTDHPIFGVGRGQFQWYYAQYAGIVAETGINARVGEGESLQAHNLYTSVLAETGTVGFVFFMGIFLSTLLHLHRARRRWLRERPDVAHLATGFFLALIAYLVSGIALHLSYERYVWFLLALAGVAALLALRGNPEHDFEIDRSAAPAATPGHGAARRSSSVGRLAGAPG